MDILRVTEIAGGSGPHNALPQAWVLTRAAPSCLVFDLRLHWHADGRYYTAKPVLRDCAATAHRIFASPLTMSRCFEYVGYTVIQRTGFGSRLITEFIFGMNKVGKK